MKKTLFAVLLLCSFAAAQSNLRYTTTSIIDNTKHCFEGSSLSGPDVCLNRTAGGTLSVETPLGAPAKLTLGTFGGGASIVNPYQGTTSVGITDTAFHALIAAASDIKIPANTIAAAGKVVHVHGYGVYTNAAASLLNAEVMLCQVSGCATGTVVAPAGCAVVTTNQANNLANGQFEIECDLVSTSTVGASGTFMAKSHVCANLGAATSAVSSCFNDTATAVSAATDETVDEFVNVAFKFSTSNAGNSAIVHLAKVELGN